VGAGYLHRNVNAADPETWVLRSAPLQEQWKGHWEAIIAGKVLTSPVVVFAGLGTPISVLIETTSLIRKALPQATKFFQVDPGEESESKVFATLKLDQSHYIQQKWGDFMNDLAQRLVGEQVSQLDAAMKRKIQDDKLPPEDTTAIQKRLSTIGLVNLGKARSNWLLHEKPYYPDDDTARAQVADLILAAHMIARITNAELRIADDSLVEFHREGRVSAFYVLASGRDHRGKPQWRRESNTNEASIAPDRCPHSGRWSAEQQIRGLATASESRQRISTDKLGANRMATRKAPETLRG
jgi:hypothetical protein